MKKTVLLLTLLPIAVGFFILSDSSKIGIAQSGTCFLGPTAVPPAVASPFRIVSLGKYLPPAGQSASAEESNEIGVVDTGGTGGQADIGINAEQIGAEARDADYDGLDLSSNALVPDVCNCSPNGYPRLPIVAGPPGFSDVGLVSASDLRFVLFVDEPSDGSTVLTKLRLKFYRNVEGLPAEKLPFFVVDIPGSVSSLDQSANLALFGGYYLFCLTAVQANALQPFIDTANADDACHSRIYVG